MSNALPGEHLCLVHQGNHSHYAAENCTICKLTAEVAMLRQHRETLRVAAATTISHQAVAESGFDVGGIRQLRSALISSFSASEIENMLGLIALHDAGNDLASQGGPWAGDIEDMRQVLRWIDGTSKATHRLKIRPTYLQAIRSGRKTFEIRATEDRYFQVGDTVTLYEIDERDKPTGEEETVRVDYVTDFAQKPGYVVWSFTRLTTC